MRFSSLHHHTTFSYKDGYGTPERHVERADELGMPKMAVTEHGNVSSHVRLEQACNKANVDPIFGVELYCGEVGEGATQRKNHLTVLAETDEGYRNLLRVVSRGWSEGFYYEPTVSGAMLREHSEGLVVLSGCSGSLLSTSLVGGKNVAVEDASYSRGKRVAANFKRLLQDAYYLEVQAFPELEKTRNINKGLVQLSEDLGIPLVATMDVHYTTPDESEMQNILHSLRPGKQRTAEDVAQQWSYDVKLTPIEDAVLLERLKATGLSSKQAEQALANTEEIAQRCNVTLPKIDNLRYPLPPDASSPQVLFRRWVNEGWKYRGINKLPPEQRQVYIDRAKYEMALIEEKGFVDYFLVVSDAVKFAKESGIPVGPARGSAAASVVCYLLRITEVDPIPFPTLLFERFIDRNRHDLPDIDLDFDDERRHLVRDYLVHRYGSERVGNLGTFVKFKGKNSLDAIQRAYNLPKADVEIVKELMIERASGDLRAASTIEDTIDMFPQVKEVFERHPDLYKSMLLEGNVMSMSVHAAGLVIANEPITNVCAVYTKPDKKTGRPQIDEYGNEAQVVSLDKHDAEYLNVLKLDALGLKNMAMIRIALEHIGMKLEDLYAIPLDDPETIQGFRDNDVVGIFQFDGRAMRSVNAGVVPDNFFEVADVNALARPGPLHSGATAEYVDVKHGRKEPTHYHPIVDGITQHTNFQIVYQEQILQVVRHLGEFSWEEAARIRKIISKKRGEQEFNQQRDKFIQGAAKHGMSAPDADKVFSMLATAGAYAFNAAHCVSYGMLAYWTMWLKRHHPQAFFVASLRKFPDKQMDLLRDMERPGVRNVPILKLHLNKSKESWTADGNGIRPGFSQIKGIGEKTADQLLMTRGQLGKFESWADVQKTKGVGPATIELMKTFINSRDPYGIKRMRKLLEAAREALALGLHEPGAPWTLPTPTHTSAEVPYDREDRDTQVVWVGIVTQRNLKDLFENFQSRTGKQLDPNDVKRPDLNEWVVLTGMDETEPLVITADRWRYKSMRDMLWQIKLDHSIILVRGIKRGGQARRAIYATDLWILDDIAKEQGWE